MQVSPEHSNVHAEENLKPNTCEYIMISKPPCYRTSAVSLGIRDTYYTLFKCNHLNQNSYLNGISKQWKPKTGNSECMEILCNHKNNLS